MVRAILAGQKTQTRRALRCQFATDAVPVEMPKTAPEGWVVDGHSGVWWCEAAANPEDALRCPYGVPGDRLWVRETYRLRKYGVGSLVDLDAVPPTKVTDSTRWFDADGGADLTFGKLRPSIHMPRWASRITLEISGVRVERLQAISEVDATAEGVQAKHTADCHYSARDAFRFLWESINGGGSWDADPWVWVVEFTRSAT